MSKEKIAFIQKNEKKENAIFVALLTLFIIIAFSASYLMKLFVSFSISV